MNNSIEILKSLLAIEWQRLETAVAIEKERSIVFPETTIIIRDIQKIMGALGMESPNKENDDDFILPDLFK